MTDRSCGGFVDGRAANLLGTAFYLTVAVIALAGQTQAATGWLGWPVVFALPAVAALELGGIALAARADYRRRLGETAYAAWALSAAVAGFAVAFNWLGHDDHIAGGFFAGMSALGYGVWLINAGDRRRDQLRAAGKLSPTAPVYGLSQWLTHPVLTRRARRLAIAEPSLGVHGSLQAATEMLRAEKQHAAITQALHRKLAETLDPISTQIVIGSYNLNKIAAGVAARADYDGLIDLLAAELTPDKITGHKLSTEADTTADSPPDSSTDTQADTISDTTVDSEVDSQPGNELALKRLSRQARRTRKTNTGAAVKRLRAKYPHLTQVQIAKRLGIDVRTVRRHLNADQHISATHGTAA